jgi:6-phosphogluconolactonase
LNCANQNTSLYVGTYTDGDSEGIYQFQFNIETGKLSDKQLVAATENPSYLINSLDKKYIYAVNEIENGTLTSYKVGDDGYLTSLNNVSSHGAHPCHLAISKQGDKVVVSNYTGGNASLYHIKKDGSLSESFQILDHNSSQEVSHAHSAQFYEDQLYVSDLGRNSVYRYNLESENYKLADSSIVTMTDKAGPRHFSLTKDGQFIYIINEYANTVTSGKKTNEGFKLLENTSTLANNYKDDSYCADIHLSENENFLYGSNRGENSIVVFKRDRISGKLKKVQSMNTQGDWPRNFTIDPSGKFLLVANQKSNNITVFKIDANNGKLSFLDSVELSAPVCLLF